MQAISEKLTPEEMTDSAKLLRLASKAALDNATRTFRSEIAAQFEQGQVPLNPDQIEAAATLIYQASLRATDEQRQRRHAIAMKLAIIHGEIEARKIAYKMQASA